jgi:hypothetical protein
MRRKTVLTILGITGGLFLLSFQNSWCWIGSPSSIHTMMQHSQVNNNMVQHSIIIGHTPWTGPDASPHNSTGQSQGDVVTQTADPGSGASGAKVISQKRQENPNSLK